MRWVLAAGAALLLAGATAGCSGEVNATPDGMRVGIAYDVGGLGNPVNVLTRKGVYAAKTQLGKRLPQVREFSAQTDETDEDRYDRLIILCQSGYNPVLAVGYEYAGPNPATGPLARAARDCPGTRFASVDDATVTAPNVANLVFADADGSYLMGVAAGLTSKSGVVGFVGGCEIPAVGSYEAGYRAGVAAARPDTRVKVTYLVTDPARCGAGFASDESARQAAERLYAAGASVVYAVAGASNTGVFTAAKSADTLGIGSVSDQYKQVGVALQSVLLTSMTKQVDRVVSGFVTTVAGGGFTAGAHREGLAGDGVGYATSGDRLGALVDRLTADKASIIDGKITVPGGL